MNRLRGRFAVLALAGLAGCTSGQSAVLPNQQAVNVATVGSLQLSVGTARIGTAANTAAAALSGLNVVATYRQANGLSAVLNDTPTLTGPGPCVVGNAATFCVPASTNSTATSTTGQAGPNDPGGDGGTNRISGIPQPATPGIQLGVTTFGITGGVFAYGFQPSDSTNSTNPSSARFGVYAEPFYDAADARTYLGGPPAYTQVRDGTYPSGFNGFTQGFNTFARTQVAPGTYTLSVLVPSSPTTSVTLNTTATLASTLPLPFFPAPSGLVKDGAGGLSVTLAIPAGVTETIVDLRDAGPAAASSACHNGQASAVYYSVVVTTPGPGVATVTFPPNLGPLGTTGQTSQTVCPGDNFAVVALGFDYPAYEAGIGQAGNTATPPQNPALRASAGQSDITISSPLTGTY